MNHAESKVVINSQSMARRVNRYVWFGLVILGKDWMCEVRLSWGRLGTLVRGLVILGVVWERCVRLTNTMAGLEK